jgi:hypothetical protein
MDEFPELNFVESMHEQREFNKKIVPCLGCWVETGLFTHVVETWDIKERYLCVAANYDEESQIITLDLEPLDHKAMDSEAKALAERIMNKYGTELVQSLKIQASRGLFQNRFQIEKMIKRLDYNTKEEFLAAEEKDFLKRKLEDDEKLVEKVQKRIIEIREQLEAESNGQGIIRESA